MAQTASWAPVPIEQGQPWKLRAHGAGGILALRHKGKPKTPQGGILDDWGFANYLRASQQNTSGWAAAWRARGWLQDFWYDARDHWIWMAVDQSDWHNFATTYQYQDPKGHRYTISGYKWFILAQRAAASAYGGFYWRTPYPGPQAPWALSPTPTVDPASLTITSVTLSRDPYGGTVADIQPPIFRLDSYGDVGSYLGVGVAMCLPGFPKGRDRDIPNYWLIAQNAGQSVPPGTPPQPFWIGQPGNYQPWGSKYPCPLRLAFRYSDNQIFPAVPGFNIPGTPGPVFIIDGQIF